MKTVNYKLLGVASFFVIGCFNLTSAQSTTPTTTCNSSNLTINATSNTSTINSTGSFRVTINFSAPIKSFAPDAVIVDGGHVTSVRKLSKTSYIAIIVPDTGTKQVAVQIEAGKIPDLCGYTNDYASNEVVVNVNQVAATPDTTAQSGVLSTDSLSSLFDKIFSTIKQQQSVPTQNSTPVVQPVVQATVQTYYCNGIQIPTTQTCNTVQAQPVCTSVYDYYSGTYRQQCQTTNIYYSQPYYSQPVCPTVYDYYSRTYRQQCQPQNTYQSTNSLGNLFGNLFGNSSDSYSSYGTAGLSSYGSSYGSGGYSSRSSSGQTQSERDAAQDAQQDRDIQQDEEQDANTYYDN